jgi:hypothetical protein
MERGGGGKAQRGESMGRKKKKSNSYTVRM